MERDYMLQVSDIKPEQVEIAAPAEAAVMLGGRVSADSALSEIVFFSQPYEVVGGRGGEIYREILRPLVAVAQELNRKVIVKLHPFESVRGRTRSLKSLLSADEFERVQVSRSACLGDSAANVSWHRIGLERCGRVRAARRFRILCAAGWTSMDSDICGNLRDLESGCC